jgi:hypothetical protein
MKYILIKLSIIWCILIISISIYGEWVISRPLSHFIQIPLTFMAVILTVGLINYTVNQIFKK